MTIDVRKLPAWIRSRCKPRQPGASGSPLGGDRMFLAVVLGALAVVGANAGSGSWQHQYEQAVSHGQPHWYAGMFPLSVDGLIVAATMVIWYAARHRLRRPWGAWLVLMIAVGATAAFNLAPDYRWPWLGPAISVWPAFAFVAAYEMAVWLVRKRQSAQPEAVPAQVAPSVPADSLDAAIQKMIATHLAGNALSARQVQAQFGQPWKVASKVRETVLASMNGHGPEGGSDE